MNDVTSPIQEKGTSPYVQETRPAPSPFALSTWEDLDRFAEQVAKSGMFGVTKKEQAICLFAIAKDEGISPFAVLKRYHVIEGRPSMKADAMLAEFLKAGGGVIYHIRTDAIVAATYFEDKKTIDEAAEKRSFSRMELTLKLERDKDLDSEARTQMYLDLIKLNKNGEQTIVRTFRDAEEKGITKGKDGTKLVWSRYPRSMLAARCDTEGIRIIMPGLICGIMEASEATEAAEADRMSLPSRERNEMDVAEQVESLERQIGENLDNSRNASAEQRRRLNGLNADLREKIRDLGFEPREREVEVKGTPVETIQDATFEMVEKEDQLDMTPPEKFEEPKPKATPKPQPDVKVKPNWKEYEIQHVGGMFRGQLLTEVDYDDLTVLAETMEKKAAKDDQFQNELNMMKAALRERSRVT